MRPRGGNKRVVHAVDGVYGAQRRVARTGGNHVAVVQSQIGQLKTTVH